MRVWDFDRLNNTVWQVDILFDDDVMWATIIEAVLSGGLTFEAANGSRDVFQGNGDGIWRPFVSGAKRAGEFDVQANVGMSLPNDGDEKTPSRRTVAK